MVEGKPEDPWEHRGGRGGSEPARSPSAPRFLAGPWAWEDKDPQAAALEAVPPPLVRSLPPMPEDPAYQDARLEMLIREAQESYRKQMSRLRGLASRAR